MEAIAFGIEILQKSPDPERKKQDKYRYFFIHPTNQSPANNSTS